MESLSQIALARNTGQLRFSPDAECFGLCFAVLLTGSKAEIGGLACNVAPDVVKRTDTVGSLSRDLQADMLPASFSVLSFTGAAIDPGP
ncbi:hypothetical protein FB001_1745 [Ensifer sp. SEMIA 135]|nr:hypothetical protein FB000_1693 [Ensifer sp. SEMIA 134]TWB21632.1 hypothetical protein FB001_1745 [Ensifer sp. SEMIA 135]